MTNRSVWKIRRALPRRDGLLWGVVGCVALCFGPTGTAAQASDAVGHTYVLRYAQPAEIVPALRAVLGPLTAQMQITADAQSNTLVITGDVRAQQVAAQAIEALDRPAPSPEGDAVLRAYAFQGIDIVSAAARLSEQLSTIDPAARATADERTGQVLVWGSEAAQRESAARLALLETAPADAATARAVADVATLFAAVALHHSRVDQVEAILRDMFRARWVRQPSIAEPQSRAYQLVASGGRSAQLVFDARSNQVLVQGSAALVVQFEKLLGNLDRPAAGAGQVTRLMPLGTSNLGKVRQAIDAYRGASPGAPTAEPAAPGRAPHGPHPNDDSRARREAGNRQARYQMGAAERATRTAYQQPAAGPVVEPLADMPAGDAPVRILQESPPGMDAVLYDEQTERRLRELGTEVEVEALPDLDVIILRGNQRDVDEVIRIIQEIERISGEAEPQVEVVPLAHVASDKLATLFGQIKVDVLAGRQGSATVTALVKPNALLIVGWGEAMRAVRELVAKLDQPVEPEGQLRVFRLKHASATATQDTIEKFFARRTALGTKVLAVADVRSNSVVVQADPRDMAEVEALITRIDTSRGDATNELRVFKLHNTLAADLGPVLQAAITGTGTAATGGSGTSAAAARSAVLKFLTIDAQGQKVLESGILGDVRITPDPRTNTLLISAPAETMELIAALVAQMDAVPASVAQIKVFTIVNGDASALVEMLRNLLDARNVTSGVQLAGAEGEDSLAPLRFSVDARTNSIIATGSAGELSIVEAILLRLDQSDSQERKSVVYRLKNAPATNVAESINEFLRSERVVQQATPGISSPFRRIESEVIVVPELISNSLILSATPRYFDEIMRLVEDLDAQPAQVLIQVLIAEVNLNKADEFGIELGLQDSLLFDRSILSGVTQSLTDGNGDIVSQNTNPTVNVPGFNFNAPGAPLGNSQNAYALRNSDQVGGQGLSSFNVGRINNQLGFGGLVLSASSESVSVLLRALRSRTRIDVLSRPQVMTLDNQPAFIQVGQRVPRITNSQLTQFGSVNSVALENVGLILGVTPRISPDGLIVMEVDAERSAINNPSDPNSGVPIAITPGGQTLRAPIFDTATAQTTVSAASGQTIVLGGLITSNKNQVHRRVPVLSDIPIIGNLFRYDLRTNLRTELLIILTPHIVRSLEDAERLKQIESARMNWCLADVEALHGPCAICQLGDCEHRHGATEIIYPDVDPRGMGIVPEELPRGPQQLGPVLQSPGAAPADAGTPPADAAVPPAGGGAPPAAPLPQAGSAKRKGAPVVVGAGYEAASFSNERGGVRRLPIAPRPQTSANAPVAPNAGGNP